MFKRTESQMREARTASRSFFFMAFSSEGVPFDSAVSSRIDRAHPPPFAHQASSCLTKPGLGHATRRATETKASASEISRPRKALER